MVVDAEPGSLIYAGLKRGVTREQFEAAIEAGQVEPLVHRFPARPGDCIMIEAGTVHAIGAGVLLAEIQQMSDATFRVYDWGRVGADGRPRELHIREALESTDFCPRPGKPIDSRQRIGWSTATSARGSRDALTLHSSAGRLTRPAVLGRTDRFTILMGMDGCARGPARRAGRRSSRLARLCCCRPRRVPAKSFPMAEAVVLTCVVP